MEGAQNYLNALEGRRTGPIIQPWIISEMDADELEERSLARYIGCDQDIFRCGDSAVDAPGVRKTAARLKISPAQVVEQIFSRAHRVQSEGSLFQIATGLRRYVTPENYGPGACGPMLIEAVAADMAAGRFYLAQDAGVPVEDVWQILFVDPIQRFIDPQFGDVPGVDGLAKCLRRHANGAGDEKRRMIVFVTSDTNKASASEPSKPEVKVQGKLEVSDKERRQLDNDAAIASSQARRAGRGRDNAGDETGRAIEGIVGGEERAADNAEIGRQRRGQLARGAPARRPRALAQRDRHRHRPHQVQKIRS